MLKKRKKGKKKDRESIESRGYSAAQAETWDHSGLFNRPSYSSAEGFVFRLHSFTEYFFLRI